MPQTPDLQTSPTRDAKLQPDRIFIYKEVAGETLQMHLFEGAPQAQPSPRPCLLWVHGGGWITRKFDHSYPMATFMRDLGWVGIVMEYRLLDKNNPGKSGNTVYDSVRDARSAMRYLRKHASALGIDSNRIYLGGGSAGGHLALGTILFDGIDEADDDCSLSCKPVALAMTNPVVDISENGFGQERVGSTWEALSPLHRLVKGMPPTILFHGTGDNTVPYAGAEAFTRKMQALGNRCDFHSFPGRDHGLLKYPEASEAIFRLTRQFFLEHPG